MFGLDSGSVFVIVIIIIIAIIVLKGFDRIAGRGPKQVRNGINSSVIVKNEARIQCPHCAEKILPAAKKCQPVKGEIGYYGLSNWWKFAFTRKEQIYIIDKCRSYHGKDFLTSEVIPAPHHLQLDGTYWHYYKSDIDLLFGTAEKIGSSNIDSSQNEYLPEIFIEKALEIALKEHDICKQNSVYSWMVGHYYYRRKNTKHYDKAIWACKQQIKISSEVAEELKKKIKKEVDEKKQMYKEKYRGHPNEYSLPDHMGYKQLAIVLEKQGIYQQAVELCVQAKDQGWAGDWDKRIARCKNKLQRK